MPLSYLRSILFTIPAIVLATVAFGSASLACSLFDTTGRTQHRVARAWSRLLLWVSGVKVRVTGVGNVRPESSYVFASNHLSYMDTPLVLAFIPSQFRFLAKKSLFRIPFLGHHLHRAGHIPVPREDARASVRVMTEAARILRERNVSILAFPEGGRSDGSLREFKEGAAYIAIKAGVPLVPLAVSGTREILPVGSLHIRGGLVRLSVGEPIPTAGLGLRDRERLTAETRRRVAALLEDAARNAP